MKSLLIQYKNMNSIALVIAVLWFVLDQPLICISMCTHTPVLNVVGRKHGLVTLAVGQLGLQHCRRFDKWPEELTVCVKITCLVISFGCQRTLSLFQADTTIYCKSGCGTNVEIHPVRSLPPNVHAGVIYSKAEIWDTETLLCRLTRSIGEGNLRNNSVQLKQQGKWSQQPRIHVQNQNWIANYASASDLSLKSIIFRRTGALRPWNN